ncbi:MAG: GIDE domain-containing protein [Polyangiaceae bacterium]
MTPVGFLLVALGIIGLIYGLIQRSKAGRVTDAPHVSTGDAAARGAQLAGPKGQISAQGGVMMQQPIYSPVTGTPCLFYELKVTAEWKEGDSSKSKDLDHQKVAAQFAINDGSGPVWIDLREGGDFEPMQSKDMEQSTGLLKGIVGGELTFGNYRLNAGIGSLGTTYKVTEKVLPVQQQLYVCGRMAEQGGIITAPKWRALIASNQTRDQLLASALKTAKIALIAGGAMFVVGGALAGIGAAMGGDDSDDANTAATASATAPAPEPAASADAEPSAEPTDEPAAPTAAAAAAPVKKPTTAATATTAKTATTSSSTSVTRPGSAPAIKPTATAAKPSIIIKPKK